MGENIKRNQDCWEKENIERLRRRDEKILEWEKSERFRKIEILKERFRENDLIAKIEDNIEISSEERWNKWRNNKKDEEGLLPDGWKQQAGAEDLLHPEGRDC